MTDEEFEEFKKDLKTRLINLGLLCYFGGAFLGAVVTWMILR